MQPRRGADGGGPDGGMVTTVRRSEGWSGAGCALRAVRRQARRWSLNLQRLEMLFTRFRGSYTIIRGQSLQQVTVPTNSPNTPNKAKTGQIGQKWQSAQNSPKIGQAPRKPQNHTTLPPIRTAGCWHPYLCPMAEHSLPCILPAIRRANRSSLPLPTCCGIVLSPVARV